MNLAHLDKTLNLSAARQASSGEQWLRRDLMRLQHHRLDQVESAGMAVALHPASIIARSQTSEANQRLGKNQRGFVKVTSCEVTAQIGRVGGQYALPVAA